LSIIRRKAHYTRHIIINKYYVKYQECEGDKDMKTKVFILLIFIMVGFGGFDSSSSLASKKLDFFKEIVSLAEGKVVEYGVKANFEISEDEEAYCLELLGKLKVENTDINVVKDDKFYSVEFKNNELKGYIESTSYDNHNVVSLNVVQYDSEYRLSDLKNRVSIAVGKDEKDVKYFDYLKAQINKSDKEKMNNDIIELLKKNNASSIDTIKIDNGYSTVAYTKNYPVMKNNGKWMDLNYAVCSYSSGDYVIIGTPIIITTY
jgi:hypothetical protein